MFKYDSNLINSTNEQRVNKAVSDLLAFAELNNDHIEKFTYEEIYKLCESLPRNKSPGLDGISYEHLKFGGKVLQRHICNLFNLVIEACYTPSCWKDSCVIPLFKGGHKSKFDPNSYRGISLLYSISKLFEKAFSSRLPSLRQNVPHQTQVAYQKHLCSTHASFNMQEVIHHNLERNSNVVLALLDSMKAFDT